MPASHVAHAVTLLGLILIVQCQAARADVPGNALRAALEGRVAAAIASYQMWDAANRDGIGSSDRTTSGGLGWGESSFLRS